MDERGTSVITDSCQEVSALRNRQISMSMAILLTKVVVSEMSLEISVLDMHEITVRGKGLVDKSGRYDIRTYRDSCAVRHTCRESKNTPRTQFMIIMPNNTVLPQRYQVNTVHVTQRTSQAKVSWHTANIIMDKQTFDTHNRKV
jgi:hypothetical protein